MSVDFDSLELIKTYIESKRFEDIKRDYSPDKVQALRSKIKISYDLSNLGAINLWELLNQPSNWVSGLGSATVQQAMQLEKLNYQILYVSGWQIAAESNFGTNTYPDLSLYPSNSTPEFVRKINNTLLRKSAENKKTSLPPIIADGESGFGGIYSVFDITSQFISAGAAGVHFEDQLASEKKCGHVGGKVLVPTGTMIRNLKAARLASDIAGVPLIILARTDANAAKLITNDFDENDKPFLTGSRSPEGFFYVRDGIDQAISRGLAYAPYADLIWCETATPNLEEAKRFADAIHAKFPGKLLAYNCSPSFNWKKHLSDDEIATFQQKIGEMGYKFQFITLAGFHTQNIAIFELAEKYKKEGMTAYSKIQENEFAREKDGYTSVKHQREVGTSYFDAVSNTISSGKSSTTAMKGSTEAEQF